VRKIRARCFCPTHGKLNLDEIVIKNGIPVCSKCSAELQFGDVRPRFNTKK
jgi:repressor of nif and glnA expression